MDLIYTNFRVTSQNELLDNDGNTIDLPNELFIASDVKISEYYHYNYTRYHYTIDKSKLYKQLIKCKDGFTAIHNKKKWINLGFMKTENLEINEDHS